jgi:Transposase DDE domain
MKLTIPGVEKRLQDRYEQLVQEHTGHAHPGASGLRHVPNQTTPQASAMAAWRFYLNPRTTFKRLAQPLLDAAADSAASHCQEFALVPIDWSKLDYRDHPSKTDRTQIGHKDEIGYKLLSALLVSDKDGQPLAPLCAQLQTAEGLLSSRLDRVRPMLSALDELAPVMGFVQGLPLGKRPVFIIDAEADSVGHYRKWDKRGFLFVVRADAERYARLQDEAGKAGKEMLLPAIAEQLQQQQAFQHTRQLEHDGEKVEQYVAEAAVVLDRPAWPNRVKDGGKRRRVKGKALPMRLIITELRDNTGQVLERWYLFTNVPKEVDAATIALWYYWRWKIETFFKLLKSAGQQLEHWQQENGRFILKRLLVACMACVLAWRLAHSQAPQAQEARKLVSALSGRQLEHGKQYTLEGLLAGLWVLLAMVAVLDRMPASRLKDLASFVLSGSSAPAAEIPCPLREAG